MSQVAEHLWQEYEAFAGRDLSEFLVAYLFVDRVAERLHAGLPREAVLCVWGITEDGRKVLLHLRRGRRRTLVLPGRNVAHVRLDHAYAHGGRPHADHADDVDLLGGDLPDLLAEL